MGIVILQLILTLLNVVMGFINFENKKYNIACFNFFAGGVCFMGFIIAISGL